MDQRKQRIAIAEACGWTNIENANTMAAQGIWKGYPPLAALIGKKDYLPDYLGDLNAMHQAEKILTSKQWIKYMPILHEIVGRAINLCIHASAFERAEAFLKTIDKWI